MSVDFALELITGFSFGNGPRSEKLRSEQQFEFSAHYMDIMAKFKASPTKPMSIENLILRHSR